MPDLVAAMERIAGKREDPLEKVFMSFPEMNFIRIRSSFDTAFVNKIN